MGGAEPPKSGPFGPKKWTFLNLTPLPSYKNPIFVHFVAKSGPVGRFGGVHHTPAPPWLRAWFSDFRWELVTSMPLAVVTYCSLPGDVRPHHGLFRTFAFETPAIFHIVAKSHWTVQWFIHANQMISP